MIKSQIKVFVSLVFDQIVLKFLVKTEILCHIFGISLNFFLELQSFITQDPDDRDFLVKNLRSFDVPVLNYVRNEDRHKEPFQISEEVLSLRP